jgi:hypothetical protein
MNPVFLILAIASIWAALIVGPVLNNVTFPYVIACSVLLVTGFVFIFLAAVVV